MAVPLLPLLLSSGGESVFAGQEQMIPELNKSGWYEPGEYEVPCDIFVEPPDAMQIGFAGPATRNPRIGERGKLTEVNTNVRRRDRDGRSTGPNLVEVSEDEKRCVAALRQSGTYQVTTETTISQWIWVVSEQASSASVTRAHTEDLPLKFERKQFIIRVRGDCSEEEIAAPSTPVADPVRDGLRSALLQALSEQGQQVDGNSVSIEPLASGGLWEFAVAISGQGCVLPSLDARADCSSPVVGPATDLLVGSLQIAGGRSRINMRIVDVETGIITTAAKGDALGSDTGALTRAASDALRGLSFPLSCAR